MNPEAPQEASKEASKQDLQKNGIEEKYEQLLTEANQLVNVDTDPNKSDDSVDITPDQWKDMLESGLENDLIANPDVFQDLLFKCDNFQAEVTKGNKKIEDGSFFKALHQYLQGLQQKHPELQHSGCEIKLKGNEILKEGDIRVPLKGFWNETKWNDYKKLNEEQKNEQKQIHPNYEKYDQYETYDEFITAEKAKIIEFINGKISQIEDLSDNDKVILQLARDAITTESFEENGASSAVWKLEKALDMSPTLNDPRIHDSVDGKFGDMTFEALQKYFNGELPIGGGTLGSESIEPPIGGGTGGPESIH